MDKDIISRIYNVDVSILNKLDIEKIKYDTHDPFSKYYSLKVVNDAILKYKSNEMSLEELHIWFNAYNWILNGGFKDNANSMEDEVIDLIRSELSWIIDGMSFVDEEDIDDYYESIKILDGILNTSFEWVVYYYEEDEEQYILLVNENKSSYVEINSDFFEVGDETDKLVLLTKKEYNNKLKLLKALNYEELEY